MSCKCIYKINILKKKPYHRRFNNGTVCDIPHITDGSIMEPSVIIITDGSIMEPSVISLFITRGPAARVCARPNSSLPSSTRVCARPNSSLPSSTPPLDPVAVAAGLFSCSASCARALAGLCFPHPPSILL